MLGKHVTMQSWVVEFLIEIVMTLAASLETETWHVSECTQRVVLRSTNVIFLSLIKRQTFHKVGCLLKIIVIEAEHGQVVLVKGIINEFGVSVGLDFLADFFIDSACLPMMACIIFTAST